MSTRKKHGPPPARKAALAALKFCIDGGMDLQAAVSDALARHSLAPEDAALATELCYGYLRRMIRLDFVLNRFLKKPEDVPAKVRRVLGLAAYEIMFLDRVPAYASVDWAVGAVKETAGAGLSKAANAVLRRVSELGEQAEDPDFYRGEKTSLSRFLANFHSCPEWIVLLWLQSYGEERAGLLLAAQAEAPPVGLRFNAAREEARELFADFAASRRPLTLDMGIAVPPGGPKLHRVEQEGLVSRQSAAAQQIMLELNCPDWPEPVWDACAGRGGKAMLLAERGRRVVASDLSLARLKGLLSENSRLGLDVPAFAADAAKSAPFADSPGTILLDAPCTGLGVLSRRPDIKYKRRPEDVERLSRTQAAMLDAAADAVRPAGLVAYLTCTLNPAENQEQVERILASDKGLSLEKEWHTPFDGPLGEFFYGAVLRRVIQPVSHLDKNPQ